MSGPIRSDEAGYENTPLNDVVAREGRTANVGGLDVVRVLPTKGRRTVGAWCFVDLMGPADAEHPDPMEVGPHPHIGLSTVTWLLEGEALHSDSLGTEQMIRPGQLNWMTAGHGIAHAELAAQPPFRGIQMWVAQPDETRHGESRFEHHSDLPGVELDGGEGTLLAGELAGAVSPARTDTSLVGAELRLGKGLVGVPTDTTFEHAVVPLDGRIKVGPEVIEPGWLALVPPGVDELPIETENGSSRMMLLGGVPFPEQVFMWWNYVARSQDEVTRAWMDWEDRTDRFGTVPTNLERIEAPAPPWTYPED